MPKLRLQNLQTSASALTIPLQVLHFIKPDGSCFDEFKYITNIKTGVAATMKTMQIIINFVTLNYILITRISNHLNLFRKICSSFHFEQSLRRIHTLVNFYFSQMPYNS